MTEQRTMQTVWVNFEPEFDAKPLLDGMLLNYSVLFEDVEAKGARRNTYSVVVPQGEADSLVLNFNARPEVNYAERAPQRRLITPVEPVEPS